MPASRRDPESDAASARNKSGPMSMAGLSDHKRSSSTKAISAPGSRNNRKPPSGKLESYYGGVRDPRGSAGTNLFSPVLSNMHKDTKTPTNIIQHKQQQNKDKLNVYLNQKYGQSAKILKIANVGPKTSSIRKGSVGRNSPTKEQRLNNLCNPVLLNSQLTQSP